MFNENGDMYKGSWKNDKKEGKGIMTYNNGKIFDGYWENDFEKENILKCNDLQISNNYINFDFENNEELKNNEKLCNDKIDLNDNELNGFINNIDFKTQYCKIENHNNVIFGVCIDKECKNENKLVCQRCIFKEHKRHEIIDIEEYNNNLKDHIIKRKKNISELKVTNNNKDIINKKYSLKFDELKKILVH